MSTQKHTQGEWIIEKREHGFYICSGYHGFVIADVTGDEITHFIGNDEEAEANAKLIAAAPEMLNALNEIVEKLSPHFQKLGAKKAFSELVALAAATKAIHNATV